MYFNKKIIYIVENAEWSITWDGRYITNNLTSKFKINSCIHNIGYIKTVCKFKNKILHFGSRSTFLPDNYKIVHDSNKIVFTWFHGTDEDKEYIESLPMGSKKADIIHTACSVSRNQLIRWGAVEEKIVVIPLGVDLSIFKSASKEEKQRIRDELGIPENTICIGSFQKDGNGWGEGNTPKLIKGPDIFCKVIEKLKKDYTLFILLTGPARGYVKNRLMEIGVPFKHFYLDNYLDIPKYYKALDYYIISSRAEGGPKAILECFATRIPFVTTRIGMVDDVIVNGENGLVSEIDDVDGLTNNIKSLIEDKTLRSRLVANGLETVKDYDWENIVTKYYQKIYSRFL